MRSESWGVRWACATIAPWCLSTGLLMSFTASAGIDATGGGSRAVREASGAPHSYVAMGPGTADLALLIGPDVEVGRLPNPWAQQRFSGLPEVSTGTVPRPDLKRDAAAFPNVDRTMKGDPLISLRPAFSRRLVHDRDLVAATFGPPAPGGDAERMAFAPGDPWTNSVVRSADFAGYQIDDGATARAPRGAFTSASEIASATKRAKLTAGNPDGATPAAPRAVRLSSTTPTPPDSTPIETAAVPVSFPELAALNARQNAKAGNSVTAVRKEAGDKPNYAEFVAPERVGREERCLAEAVYFEARSESEAGQAAVAQVVLNRVKSGLYPSSICGVVYQNRNRHLACQFTFACEGKSLRVTEPDAWTRATRIASNVLKGSTYLANVGEALNYHANYVRPYWARYLQKTSVIGRHIFYKPRGTDG
jgi:spore germination cell wall hydrolase CwlJ-like protein